MKSMLSNVLLIVTAVLWLSVDDLPFMKVLGFPMMLLAFANFAKYSKVWRKVSRFIDDGMRGKFDYYEE